ncbi:hypothetical protein [Weissella cibaria]|jgi:CCR4-NOT transcriptional regulation complex, NOT5 subunit|uniref:hypothetical protein n=2 Tax=Weissella cibaria TaxID=137591 RepID=UPI000E4E75CB|nr:hypothetical protein [Weissella cibaria]MCB5826684.1 hypothetical protein [Weissella cibaria]MCB5858265.1 hypothetical protein [Weissella cibaria]MCB5860694.1 hypothetical protein [Weissella cibaria]MCB5862281.1 hypothetical protein [Weissella cibaria]MCB5865211.1 hypothetical protein [Weissella cibaria]
MIKETQSTLKNYEHKSNRHWVASGLTALGVTVLTISPLVTTTTSILQPTTVFATDNARNLTVTEQLQIARLQAAITNYQAVANVQLQNEAGWPAQLTQAIMDAQSMMQTIQTASYLTGNRDRGGQPFGDDQVTNATNRIMSYALAIQVAQIRQDDPTWYAKMASGALASNITYDPLTSIAFGAQDGFPWMQGMLQQILAVYADNTANDLVNSEAPVTSSAADASDVTSSSAVEESNATPDEPSSSEVSDSTVSSSAADTSSSVVAPSVSATPESSSSSDSAVDSASSTTADSSVSSSAVDTSVSAVTPSAGVAPDTSGSVSAGISSDVTSDTAVSTATSSVSVASETSTKTSAGAATSNKTGSADSSSAVNPSVTNVSDVTVASPSSVSLASEVASATADGLNSLVANSAPITDQLTTLQPNQALATTTLRNMTNLANGLTTVAGGVTTIPSAPQASQVTRFLAGAASAATANNVAQAQAAYTASAASSVAATAANGSTANGLDTGATVQAGTVNATDQATTHLRDTQFDTATNQLPVVASILSTLFAGLGGLFFTLWRRRKESSVEESERLAAEDDQFFDEIDKMKDNWK